MHSLNLFYSISNGGDGSAYPRFSLIQELADIHQEIHNELRGEGWGEPCTGCITLQSESPITISDQDQSNLITKESLLSDLEYYLEGGWSKKETIKNKAQKYKQQIEAIQ